MKNIIYNNCCYSRIFIKDNNTLIKFSALDINNWQDLKQKSLSFLNTPTKISKLSLQEKFFFPNSNSKIEIPYLNNYQTLYNLKDNLKLKEVLYLFKRILTLVKKMHLNDVIHSDLFASNIMISNTFDISFIDFDQAIINNNVSCENIYYEDCLSLKEKKRLAMIDDKLDILSILLYYLIYGNYQKDISFDIDVNDLFLPNILQKELDSYLAGKQEPQTNYYFEDILDELASLGEIPSKKKKLSSFNN